MGGGGGGKFISSVGNLSVQYNLQALSVAIAIFGKSTEPTWAKNSLSGVVFAGAFAGMVCMGYLGDLMGRRIGMLTTLFFVVVGALLTGMGTWGSYEAIYGELVAYRFILGFGVGGIYPMAAATAAEDKGSDDSGADDDDPDVAEANAARAAWSFFWQSVGAAVPYALAWPLVAIIKPDDDPEGTGGARGSLGRVIMFLGALPAFIVFIATFRGSSGRKAAAAVQPKRGAAPSDRALSYELAAGDEDGVFEHEAANGSSPLAVLKRNPQYLASLIGTGGTWFLYDVTFYGINVYTPQILSMIFTSESLGDTMWQGLLTSALGIPTCALAIWVLPRIGGRALNAYGFLLNGAAFLLMAVLFQINPPPATGETDTESAATKWVKFAAFGAAIASLNWGPNVGTYAVPCQLYPASIRGTFHGLSAASGKLGAVVGAFLFPSFIDKFGVAALFFLQVGVNVAGAALSWWLLPPKRPSGSKAGSKSADGFYAENEEDNVYSSLLVQ